MFDQQNYLAGVWTGLYRGHAKQDKAQRAKEGLKQLSEHEEIGQYKARAESITVSPLRPILHPSATLYCTCIMVQQTTLCVHQSTPYYTAIE